MNFMKLMRPTLASLLFACSLGLGTVALASDTPTSDTSGYGPCDPLVQHTPTDVGSCYWGACLWYCVDPHKPISYTGGTCLRQEGPCSEFIDKLDAETYLECSCEQSHCWTRDFYNGGTTSRTNCVNSGS